MITHYYQPKPTTIHSTLLTSHFFMVHLTGTEKGPAADANWTSPSRSSLICRDQIV